MFYHGFTACKEVNRKELHALAEAGFLAIGVDNWGHGQRRLPDFEARFADPSTWQTTFVAMVNESVAEVPTLVETLIRQKLLKDGRLGLAGISMGGMIAYGSLALEKRIRAIATIVATPKWLHAETWPTLFPCAILSMTAGRDALIDSEEVARIHQTLAPYYSKAPERIQHINYQESEHMMRPTDFDHAWGRLTQWFADHLDQAAPS